MHYYRLSKRQLQNCKNRKGHNSVDIIFDKVSKHYTQGGERITALDGVSFKVKSGDSLSVIGHSGSGKTTLLSLLSGLEFCDGGKISMGETIVSDFSDAEFTHFRAHNMGIVFQQYHLMPHLTALENVLLPLQINKIPRARDTAREILVQVGLEKRIHHLPSQMSGGENQRVAIARAMVHAPKVLLADEPSGSLDLKNGEMVMDLLFQMSEDAKTTLILVTHDEDLAKRCHKVVHLKGGKVI